MFLPKLIGPDSVTNCGTSFGLVKGGRGAAGSSFGGVMALRKINKTLMQQIADRLGSGETLLKITAEADMPSYRTVTRAVLKDDELYEIYRKGRLMQAEYYSDHINDIAMAPLPDNVDPRMINAEVQRRRLEVDTLKFTMAKLQPWGLRDKKEEAPAQQSITISWQGNEVTAEQGEG